MGPKWLRAPLVAVLSLCIAAAARPADAPAPEKFTGRVEAAEQAGIAARVAGVVDKVAVDIGDRVKKGQLLIELSAPELKDDLDAATARLDQAKAEVEQAEAAAQAAKARTVQADAALEAARAVLKRVKAQPAAVPQAMVEEAEAQAKTAEAARDVAAAELLQAQAGVKTAQAGVAVAQVGVRRAQTQLDFTRITAPFDGIVSRRTVDVGEIAGPSRQGESAPLVTVMRDDMVHIVFDVDELSASKVAVGAPAVVHVAALTGAEFKGKVTRMGAAINPATGTLRAEIELPNPDGKLRPGLFVTVEVKKDEPGK